MNNCKYFNGEITGITEHEYCENEELIKQNKLHDKNEHLKCIGIQCGRYEENYTTQSEEDK
ncbi:MAG: hypothetical protein J5857_01530 [Treponema sp.]|nr:hypothetical protein [Treponema sp.]